MAHTKTRTPVVSIAMPFRNSARTLAEAIRSILFQTFEDWELLLCDDGSADGSLEVVKTFDDPRIVVWSDGLFKTLGTRLNECISRARGVYLARMDADDISYPERISRQVSFLEANSSVDLVGASMAVFGEGGRCVGRRSGPQTHAHICRTPALGFRLFHPTWVGKLSWFRRHGYIAEALRCEDQDLLFRACQDSTYANLPDILLAYREGELELNKIFASRRNWYRRFGGYVSGFRGLGRRGVVGSVLLSKTVLDWIAVTTGLGHTLLPQRAMPASADERARFRAVWVAVQGGAAIEAETLATGNG